MHFLWSLFSPQRHHRYYACLDAQGICLSFRHCPKAPRGHGWVEISKPNLSWLHQPLPADARVSLTIGSISDRQLLGI
nr:MULTISPECIES: hypothetical protein [unclassified Pseudomonas]